MKHCTVVIVEDDRWVAGQYRRVLARHGHDSYVAPHALAAIDMIDDVKPDAILLDMLLSGSTGLALLNELQSHADLAAIPVVVVTNTADQLRLGDLRHYGVRVLLDKATMHPEDIVAAVQKVTT